MHPILKKVEKNFKLAPYFWWGDYIDVRFFLAYQVSKEKKKKILDIGCGAGIILSMASDSCFKCGIDIDLVSLNYAKTIVPNGYFFKSKASFLPFKDNVFEIILLSHLLGEINDKKEKEIIMKEVYRCLKQNGLLLITNTNRDNFITGRFRDKKLSLKELKELVLKEDFEIKSIIGWNPIPSFIFFLPKKIKKGYQLSF